MVALEEKSVDRQSQGSLSALNFTAIYSVAVEIFQCGQTWWTDVAIPRTLLKSNGSSETRFDLLFDSQLSYGSTDDTDRYMEQKRLLRARVVHIVSGPTNLSYGHLLTLVPQIKRPGDVWYGNEWLEWEPSCSKAASHYVVTSKGHQHEYQWKLSDNNSKESIFVCWLVVGLPAGL